MNQPYEDLFKADAFGVVLNGKAKEQLFDAYRYYKQLIAAQGQVVSYTTKELTAMALLTTGTANPMLLTGDHYLGNDIGLGKIPANTTVNFTGHSLGGHVAALLAEMVGELQGETIVGDVVTYNAPGTSALFDEIRNWLGIETNVQTGIIGSKHIAIIGEGGIEVTAGLGQINGTKQFSFIEEEVLVANHSIVKLSDVFAIKAALVALDPLLADVQLETILKSASNQYSNSLEKTLAAALKLIGLNNPTILNDRESLKI